LPLFVFRVDVAFVVDLLFILLWSFFDYLEASVREVSFSSNQAPAG
jgi:hypothetical protein